jgi:hypothetical protein
MTDTVCSSYISFVKFWYQGKKIGEALFLFQISGQICVDLVLLPALMFGKINQ